jgi:Protein of unknown function (DUF3618)
VSDGTRPALPDRRGHPERKDHPNGNRTARQIEAELDRTRARLAETVDTLVERVQPGSIASRGADRAKQVVVTPDGRVRVGRLVKVAVSAAAVFGALAILRGWLRRRD